MLAMVTLYPYNLYSLRRNQMKKPTLSQAKQMIRKANPGIKNLNISWNHKPNLCPLAHGTGNFYSSVVNVQADSYRHRKMIFTVDSEGSWIH